MYFHQLATGGIDQLVRVTDLNADNDANDAGEAVLVYSNAATGFTSVDVVSLLNGDVLITDNSGITVVRLRDLDDDGDFLDAGESDLYVGGAGAITQARQMDILRRTGDMNASGVIDIDDLLGVISAWGPVGACVAADFDRDGDVDIDDLLLVISNWG